MFERLYVTSHYLVPHHLLSRMYGWLAYCRWSWFKNWAIARLVRVYGVDLSEAAETDITKYAHFNAFFTRHLKHACRPIAEGLHTIASPVDGSVSEFGYINEGRLLQAKGSDYSLHALLADDALAEAFDGGAFATLYLAPKDYHRVHMPFSGRLMDMIYVPGRLFSVSPASVSHVKGLFAKNERVICVFETSAGPMVVILVGAMIVGSIGTQWHGLVTPPRKRKIQTWNYEREPISLNKGADMGHFELGSTAIVLFPRGKVTWSEQLQVGQSIRMGEKIGVII